MNANAGISVDFRSNVLLTDAFPSGYNQGDIISFTIGGVKNPSTVGTTDPISVKIFYTEFQSDINFYEGTNMTLNATASPLLQMSVFAPKNWTGEVDSQI